MEDLTHIPPPDIRPPDPEEPSRPRGREIPNHPTQSGVTIGGWGERPPRYWEIEIAADTPGIDYKAVFLVPVY